MQAMHDIVVANSKMAGVNSKSDTEFHIHDDATFESLGCDSLDMYEIVQSIGAVDFGEGLHVILDDHHDKFHTKANVKETLEFVLSLAYPAE